MSSDFTYYIFILAVIVVGVVVMKKVTSCFLKSVLLFVAVAALVFLYFLFFRT